MPKSVRLMYLRVYDSRLASTKDASLLSGERRGDDSRLASAEERG